MGWISVQHVGKACKNNVDTHIELWAETMRNGALPRIAYDFTGMITNRFVRMSKRGHFSTPLRLNSKIKIKRS
jgi:hypothetical protein